MGDTFSELPLLIFSTGQNLSDKLVHADTFVSPNMTTLWKTTGNFSCRNCVSRSHYVKCESFTHPSSKKASMIKQLITCKSTHVVYVIMCPCPLLYVGMYQNMWLSTGWEIIYFLSFPFCSSFSFWFTVLWHGESPPVPQKWRQ